MSTTISTTGEVNLPRKLQADEIDLIKRTICRGASDDELKLFLHQCNRTQLDPFSKQIHAVKRWDANAQREVMSIQVGIDGFRIVAERSGEMDGQEGPFWCGPDGIWKDAWISNEAPVGAKVNIFRKGRSHPYTGFARFTAYVQTKKDGTPNQFWRRMPDVMLAKCAEALALRKAFPNDLSGLYISEEMGDTAGEHETQPVRTTPAIAETPAPHPAPTPTPAKPTMSDADKAKWFLTQISLAASGMYADSKGENKPLDESKVSRLLFLRNVMEKKPLSDEFSREVAFQWFKVRLPLCVTDDERNGIMEEIATQGFDGAQCDTLSLINDEVIDRLAASTKPLSGAETIDNATPF